MQEGDGCPYSVGALKRGLSELVTQSPRQVAAHTPSSDQLLPNILCCPGMLTVRVLVSLTVSPPLGFKSLACELGTSVVFS